MLEHPYGWWSLLPPLVAIAMAIVTRRVVLSLVLGIFAGALLMARGDVGTAVYHTWETHLWSTLIDSGKLRVFSFTLLMGALVGVITRSGGMQGLIDLVSPWANNRRRSQLATWFMGLLVFFDDYANTILLGSTLRPLCDRLKISREKLAYLVDSTAAPVAGVALVSTWVAVEVDYIATGLETLPAGENALSGFGIFLASIPYRFYVLGALLMVPLTALLGRDFGAMWRAEQLTLQGQDSPGRIDVLEATETARAVSASWIHAVLPILLTLAVVMTLIYRTGAQSVCADRATAAGTIVGMGTPSPEVVRALEEVKRAGQAGRVAETMAALTGLASARRALDAEADVAGLTAPIRLRDVVGAADSSLALQYGSLAGLALALVMAGVARLLTLDEMMESAFSGARVILPAIVILWTASAMSRMTTDTSVTGESSTEAYAFQDHRLYTAAFLTDLITPEDAQQGEVAVTARLLPSVVFLLAAVVAFCTGTSWGTMGILVPMVVQATYALLTQGGETLAPDDPILLCSVGGVLAGAVFGDHCSPISDTTVLSSQACSCDHLAHVWTQMPYAVCVAIVSVVLGTLPVGFGVSVWLLLPVQMVTLVLLLRFLGRPVEDTSGPASV